MMSNRLTQVRKLDDKRKEQLKTDEEYSQKLEELWKFYLEGFEYQRKTNDWQKMGFQGNDPTTDF